MDQMKWRHTMELKKWEWINLRKKKTVGKIKVPKIAVIDSGINVDHQWFKNRLDRENSINLALDEGNEDDKTKPAYSDTKQGHGSHVRRDHYAGNTRRSTSQWQFEYLVLLVQHPMQRSQMRWIMQ